MAGIHHITPVTARIIRNRDIVGAEAVEKYLRGSLKDLYSPHLLKDMDLAVEILKGKTGQGKRIRIVGDYDIDGVCSTYLLYRALTRSGPMWIMRFRTGLRMVMESMNPLSAPRLMTASIPS